MNAQSPSRRSSVCSDYSSGGGGDDHQSEIRSLEAQIAELRQENAQLREAARGFGELAERLNEELRRMTRKRS